MYDPHHVGYKCPHCLKRVEPILDPDEYEWDHNRYGELKATCPFCEKHVVTRCTPTYVYQILPLEDSELIDIK